MKETIYKINMDRLYDDNLKKERGLKKMKEKRIKIKMKETIFKIMSASSVEKIGGRRQNT